MGHRLDGPTELVLAGGELGREGAMTDGVRVIGTVAGVVGVVLARSRAMAVNQADTVRRADSPVPVAGTSV